MSEDKRNQDNLDKQADSQRGGLLHDLFDGALGQGDDLGDVVQPFLGGADPGAGESDENESGFLDGLLGSALGQLLPSVADDMLGNLNLSPETAQAVMAFVATKVVGGRDKEAPAGAQRLDLGGILEQLGDEESDEPSSLALDWAKELAAKTDLDADTALEAIQMLIFVLGGESVASAKRKVKRRKKKRSSSKPKRKSTKSTASKKTTSSAAKKKSARSKKKTSSTAKRKSTRAKKKTSSTAKKKSTRSRKRTSSTAKRSTRAKKKTSSTAKKKSTRSKKKTSSTAKRKSASPRKKSTGSRKKTSS